MKKMVENGFQELSTNEMREVQGGRIYVIKYGDQYIVLDDNED